MLLSLIQTCSEGVKNGAICNGYANQHTLKDKAKPTINGDVCNGTVMNGMTHLESQVRQRHAEKENRESTSSETVTETGINLITFVKVSLCQDTDKTKTKT